MKRPKRNRIGAETDKRRGQARSPRQEPRKGGRKRKAVAKAKRAPILRRRKREDEDDHRPVFRPKRALDTEYLDEQRAIKREERKNRWKQEREARRLKYLEVEGRREQASRANTSKLEFD